MFYIKVIVSLTSLVNFKCFAKEFNCSNAKEIDKYMEESDAFQSSLFSVYVNTTRYENLAEIFQEAEALGDISFTVDDILPANKSLYLKRRPPMICDRPAKAVYHITITSLDSINESSMTYNLDIYLTVCWIDHRLRFPETNRAYRILDPNWLSNVWQPDTVFKNAREVTFHERLAPNHYFWMLPNNTLVYSTKLTLLLTCNMDFRTYPHDTQECGLEIESMSYTTKELLLKWDAEQGLSFKTKGNKLQTPQFRSVHNKTEECSEPYLTGSYSCIRIVFYLRRRLGYHLIHTYVPSGFIVVLSWVTFWVKPRDIAARIGLGVTSLLTLITLSTQSQESLPPVSYGKAIDIWMSACALFVFCSILEFAIINYLVCRFHENEDDSDSSSKCLQNVKTFKDQIQAYFSRRKIQIIAHNIDRFSRIFFPVCFALLNVWYWNKYLQEDEIDGSSVNEDGLNEV